VTIVDPSPAMLEPAAAAVAAEPLGVETPADTLDGLGELFRRHGVDSVAWYATGLFADRWRDDVAVGGGHRSADAARRRRTSRRRIGGRAELVASDCSC
jgi:hypothetical protein